MPSNRITLIAMFVSSCAFAFGQTPSIGPLSLGMDLAAAQQNLGAAYKLQLENHDAFNISDYDASKDGYKGNLGIIHDGYALQFTGNKLDYVEHSVMFSAGTEPRMDKTIASLLEKYGPRPTYRTDETSYNRAVSLEWVFDSSGAVSQDTAEAKACDVPTDAKAIRTSHNFLLSFPITFQGARCNITVRAELASDSHDSSILSWLHVYMIDHRVPAAAIQAQRNANKAPL